MSREPSPKFVALVGLALFVGVALRPILAAEKATRELSPAESNELLLRAYPLNPTDQKQGDLLPALREKLLKAYPVESLKTRLEYEAAGRKRVEKQFPRSTDKAVKDEIDMHVRLIDNSNHRHFDRPNVLRKEWRRGEALAALHEQSYKNFVESPGFGMERTVYMRDPRSLDIVKDWKGPNYRVAFDKVDGWSEAEAGEKVNLSAKPGGFFNGSMPSLPDAFALAGLNRESSLSFAGPDSWGVVVGDKKAIGFAGHNFHSSPSEAYRVRRENPDPKTPNQPGKELERWAIRKLHLVGLLKEEKPTVYLTDNLPSMQDIPNAPTREVDDFEKSALKQLGAGKEIVTEATTNRIRMVGAVRMGGHCAKCHEGSRGDLLGAFTYELVRVPAFVPEEKK